MGATVNSRTRDLHNVSEIRSHPNFNSRTFDFDAAILILSRNIKFDRWSKQEIVLPRMNEPLPERTEVLVTGWGETQDPADSTSVLRAVILDVTNQRECHSKYLRK